MKKRLIIAFTLNLIFAGSTLACTTHPVTKAASEDGSVMVGHSDDLFILTRINLSPSPLVCIPQVDHTYAYFDGSYAIKISIIARTLTVKENNGL